MRRKTILAALLLLSTLCGPLARAQEASAGQGFLSIGTMRTQLEASAVRLAIKYAADFSGRDIQMDFENGLTYLTPEIDIQTGEEDALDAVNLKLSGAYLHFATTTVGGIETPNSEFFHTIPFGIGFESDREFRNSAVLAEFGYAPWYQGAAPALLKKSKIGLFFQGGYKFAEGEIVSANESREDPDSALMRLKAVFAMQVPVVPGTEGRAVDGMADLKGWRDLANGEWYYSIKLGARLILTADKSFDLLWERGSGAPNFNEGEQFSANLTMMF